MDKAHDTAERLIETFGSLPQVLSARPAVLARRAGADERAIATIVSFRAAMLHALRVRLDERPVLSDSRRLHDYLRAQMAHRTAEQLRVLYLTGHNLLIRDAVISDGTLDEAPSYAREIIHRALELGAANMVLVHNHPSGDRTPGDCDVRMTRRLIDVARPLNLCVLDHVVVGRDGCTSMRAAGLI